LLSLAGDGILPWSCEQSGLLRHIFRSEMCYPVVCPSKRCLVHAVFFHLIWLSPYKTEHETEFDTDMWIWDHGSKWWLCYWFAWLMLCHKMSRKMLRMVFLDGADIWVLMRRHGWGLNIHLCHLMPCTTLKP
jgi:hypothetical protein